MNWEIIEDHSEQAKIKVIGVGGAGGNAVIHMMNHKQENYNPKDYFQMLLNYKKIMNLMDKKIWVLIL